MRHLPALLIYVWAIGGIFSTFKPGYIQIDAMTQYFDGVYRVGYQLMFAVGILVHVVCACFFRPANPLMEIWSDIPSLHRPIGSDRNVTNSR